MLRVTKSYTCSPCTVPTPSEYKNVLKNPSIRVDARGAEVVLKAKPITDAKVVKSVIEKFREKYGAADVKKYYSKFDVAVVVQLT